MSLSLHFHRFSVCVLPQLVALGLMLGALELQTHSQVKCGV